MFAGKAELSKLSGDTEVNLTLFSKVLKPPPS